jgi:hypothetical protein
MDPAGALARLLPGQGVEGLSVSCRGGATLRGADDCVVQAKLLREGALALRDVRLSLAGIRVAPDDEGQPRPVALKKISVEACRMDETDAARFLSSRIKALRGCKVSFLPGGEAEVSGRRGVPFRARVVLVYDPAADAIRVERKSLRLAGVPCHWLFRGTGEIPLGPRPGRPSLVVLSGFKTSPDAKTLEVSP